MIIEIINAFNKFVKVIKRNGSFISLYAIVLFIMLYSFIVNPINPNDIVNRLSE